MDIDFLRKEIDEIDRGLSALLEKRLLAAVKIAEYKKENELPVFNEAREAEVIKNACENASPETQEYIKEVYKTILKVSKNCQNKIISETED